MAGPLIFTPDFKPTSQLEYRGLSLPHAAHRASIISIQSVDVAPANGQQAGEDKMVQLTHLSSFDGSFSSTALLQALIGGSAVQEAQGLSVSEKI